HAADEGSLEAFALLAPELAHAKILVIATAREGAGVDTSVGKALPARIRECEVIALSGLTLHDVERYIDDTVGYAVPNELARAVFAKTAGNPLFLREAVRLVASRAEGRAELRPQDVELPEVARELLRDRVGTLDAEVRRVLEAASVVGEEFELSVLRRVVAPVPPERLLARLDAAVQARFIEPRQDAHVYAFSHALIREALYEALPAADRVRLHMATADALRSAAVVEPRTAAIAYHLHHALPEAPAEDVARFSRLAGNDAARVFAYDDAAQFYAWTLAAQGYGCTPDPRATCEVLLASAAALRWVGRTPEARQQCVQAIELAQRESFADLLVEVARSLRPTVWLATIADPLVLGALEESLRLLPESATTRRAQAYLLLSTIPPYSLDCRVSGELAEKALGLARELGDHALEMEAMVASLHSLSGPDSTDSLLARVDEILKLDGPPISWWSAEAFFARYNALLQRGDMKGAERALEAFGECARLMRLPEAIWQYERVRAQAAANAGDFDRAEARFNELLANSAPFQASATYQYAAHMNALSWARNDRPLPFGSMLVIGGSPEVGWKWAAGIPQFEAERILGLIDVGDLRGAAAALDNLVGTDLRGVTRDGSYPYVLSKLSLAAQALSDTRRARMLYDALLPYADRCAVSGFSVSLGSVSHYLGALARFLGMRADARRHFDRALEDNVRFGQPARAARTRAALAELDREGLALSAQPAVHPAHQP
ncbi:MAG TPA: hypothetical protein VKU41_25670, partial [Polyangiaceae bacterium]|nr:hypothetical protein [Polyangiaceae bacterium]